MVITIMRVVIIVIMLTIFKHVCYSNCTNNDNSNNNNISNSTHSTDTINSPVQHHPHTIKRGWLTRLVTSLSDVGMRPFYAILEYKALLKLI